ncbi:MAG: hypothetical protein LDL33_04155 [Desulfomonile sp.]|nr:hypothetical protein [Desulfomonile sp.]
MPFSVRSTPAAIDAVVAIDGKDYALRVNRPVKLDPTAPRLVVVAHQETPIATELLRVCIDAIQRFTPEPHELWVVDNNSPLDSAEKLLDEPDVNVILNRTEPLPVEARATDCHPDSPAKQLRWGSYANAIGLELALRCIDPLSACLMTMHMDVMPCRRGWLTFLRSKLDDGAAAAGVRLDRTRTPEGVLHVLGYMVDYQVFRGLGLDFFPELPAYDVGDLVTVRLRRAGHRVFACRNTLWEPELAATLPDYPPLRDFPVDRSLDDDGNPIFLHLGRGVRRARGEPVKGVDVQDWIRFAREHLLK